MSTTVTMATPTYVVYTDSDLERARSAYFEEKRLGTEHSMLSKELLCRLIRHTMTNMLSMARVTSSEKSPKKATKKPRQTGNAQPTENDASSDFEGDSSPAVLKS